MRRGRAGSTAPPGGPGRVRHARGERARLPVLMLMACALTVVARGDEPLRQKIGQMIVVGLLGPTASDTLLADLSVRNLGGVILSGANGNLKNPLQIQQLTARIRAAAATPPFIATDQEGGVVARLNGSNGFAATVSAYTLGTTYASLDSTRKQTAMMAGWLATSGFNVDFAPVADVNVNPGSPAIGHYGRSFSASAVTVAQHDRVFMDECHAKGIMTALKHFPGHGSAGTDSHLSLPDITATWSAPELIPYTELVGAGAVDMVMVGHLFNAGIDSVYPSSLSRSTIQGLLRDSLGFSGVVITDDLYGMKAITDSYGFWDAAEKSINAGTDVLLYVSNTYNGSSLCRQLVDTLEARVLRGVIPETRINESFARVTALKARYPATPAAVATDGRGTVPADFALLQNYPNPFNPATTITYRIAAAAHVTLTVYDVLGRAVAVPVNEPRSAGLHTPAERISTG
jgi:beta-N-acetylhexosaminidase